MKQLAMDGQLTMPLKNEGHCMLENIKCTKIINPGQTPVDRSDQPVFALTKELQFRFLKMFQNYFPILDKHAPKRGKFFVVTTKLMLIKHYICTYEML